jgi:hypothetical protein
MIIILFRYIPSLTEDTLGFSNGALPAKTNRSGLSGTFGSQLPRPFSPPRQRHFTPAVALWASLEAYYSRSKPLVY